MWDKLVNINTYNRRGLTKLKGMKEFGTGVSKLIQNFSSGLKKCSQQLKLDFSLKSKETSLEYEEYTTLSFAVTSVTKGLETLARQLELSTGEIMVNLVEPLDQYTKVWQEQQFQHIAKAERFWKMYQTALKESS